MIPASRRFPRPISQSSLAVSALWPDSRFVSRPLNNGNKFQLQSSVHPTTEENPNFICRPLNRGQNS
jgi:hypothetical protein